jgi:DNA-binding transcriptional regulator YiaG
MNAQDIRNIRLKLKLSETDFATLFGLSDPEIVKDIESGAVVPARFIITMLNLLSNLPESNANELMKQIRKSEIPDSN